jgi:hypothetical protein
MANLEKPITTQEELDSVLGERLKRARESEAKKFEGWKSPEDIAALTSAHEKALSDLTTAKDTEIGSLKEQIQASGAESAKYKTDLDKMRIALAAGLDVKYADRLKGETEDEWKADAEMLAKDSGKAHIAPPMGNPEPRPIPQTQKEIERNAFASMLKKMEE